MTYATVTGTASYSRSKYTPHDKTHTRIVRNTHNAAATNVADNVVVNMFTIPADSVLIGVWTHVVVNNEASGDDTDIGLAGGVEFGANINGNQAAGTIIAAEGLTNPMYILAANQVTITGNGTTWDSGTLQVTAAYIETDSYGAAS